MDEQRVPNQAASREPAEGPREDVEANEERNRKACDHFDDSDTQSGERERAGGITNRPLDEEIANQRRLRP
jgi:hypothetical protein